MPTETDQTDDEPSRLPRPLRARDLLEVLATPSVPGIVLACVLGGVVGVLVALV